MTGLWLDARHPGSDPVTGLKPDKRVNTGGPRRGTVDRDAEEKTGMF